MIIDSLLNWVNHIWLWNIFISKINTNLKYQKQLMFTIDIINILKYKGQNAKCIVAYGDLNIQTTSQIIPLQFLQYTNDDIYKVH